MLYPGTSLELRSSEDQEAQVCVQEGEWSQEAAEVIRRFPEVLHGDEVFREDKNRVFTVQAKEIQWRIPFDQIPRLNRGLQYQSGELGRSEILQHL